MFLITLLYSNNEYHPSVKKWLSNNYSPICYIYDAIYIVTIIAMDFSHNVVRKHWTLHIVCNDFMQLITGLPASSLFFGFLAFEPSLLGLLRKGDCLSYSYKMIICVGLIQ